MKLNVYGIIGIVLIIITAGVNLWGYFYLPDTMATQFSLTGGTVNTMPSFIYLLFSFVLVTFLAIRAIVRNEDPKSQFKTIFFGVIIAVLNIVLIASQV